MRVDEYKINPYYIVSYDAYEKPEYPLFIPFSTLHEKIKKEYYIDPNAVKSVISYFDGSDIKEIKTPFNAEQIKEIKLLVDAYYNSLDYKFLCKVRHETKKRETYRIPVVRLKMKYFKKYIFTTEGVGICYYDLIILVNAIDGQIMDIKEI